MHNKICNSVVTRIGNRANDALRMVEIIPGVNSYAEGSCQVSFGNTKVIVTATVEKEVPKRTNGGERTFSETKGGYWLK